MYLLKALLLVLIPLTAFSAELVPFDLKYPNALERSQLKEESINYEKTQESNTVFEFIAFFVRKLN